MRSKIDSKFNELVTSDMNPTGGVTHLNGDSVINWQNGVVENGKSVAITKLEEALMWLRYRTSNRETQGVENTYNTHKS